MTSRVAPLSIPVALAAAALLASPARAIAAPSVVSPLPAGSFVLDGGDIEAGSSAWESADRVVAVPGDEPSLAGSLAALPLEPLAEAEQAPAPRPMAFEYSDGYRVRLKIHKYASFATLPLFAAQYAVGQKLYDGNASDSLRSAHSALAASTAVLFGVNTVTGVWNLYEGRKDPNGRTRRTVHGILMLAADAGFVATGLLAPDDEGEGGGSASTHRTVALTSMAVATVAYLMMLIH
jgi:hypothetical protein